MGKVWKFGLLGLWGNLMPIRLNYMHLIDIQMEYHKSALD
jgi:hypothetical protein